jgi:hypothetical protein
MIGILGQCSIAAVIFDPSRFGSAMQARDFLACDSIRVIELLFHQRVVSNVDALVKDGKITSLTIAETLEWLAQLQAAPAEGEQ